MVDDQFNSVCSSNQNCSTDFVENTKISTKTNLNNIYISKSIGPTFLKLGRRQEALLRITCYLTGSDPFREVSESQNVLNTATVHSYMTGFQQYHVRAIITKYSFSPKQNSTKSVILSWKSFFGEICVAYILVYVSIKNNLKA